MAVLRKAKTTMQGKKALWVARGARIKAFKKSKGVQAIRWGKRVKCVIEIGVWGWALADGAYIQVVKNEIVHRCKLLYEQVDAKWVLKARIMGETVKDLSGIVSASAKKIKKGMMQMPQRIRKDYIGMRTIQNYGKLVQVDKNQIHDNPLILGFTKLTLAFSSVTDTIQDYWANKSRRLFKWDIAYHYKAHNRQIFSMGVGKVGFAIFTDGTKFSAEYLTTAKDYTLEGYNRKLVYKNIEHMYFYNLGKQKVIESYYILGLYQHLKAIMKVNQTSDGKSFDVSKTGKVKDQVKKAKAGDVVLTEITPHTQNHGVYDTVSVLFGRINKSEDGIQPIKGSPFSGAVNVVKDITTKWKYHTIKTDYGQASAFDITWQQSSNLRKNKAQYITTLEGIREQELKNARNLKIVVINFLDKLFPASAQEKAAREALMDGLKKTATEFGVKLTEEAEKNVRNVLATMTLDQLKNHVKTLGEMKAQRAKDKSTLDGYNARIKGHENKIKVYQAEKAAAQALCTAAMFWSFGTAAGLGVAATLAFDYLISEEKDKLALVKQDKQTLLTNMQSSLNKFNDMCTTTLTSFGSRDVIGDFNSRKQKIR